MAFIQRFTVAAGPTDGSGNGTFFTPAFTGKIVQIRYVAVDYTAGVDFAITLEGTGENVWTENNVNASTTRAPRQPTHDVNGAAALYAAGGTAVLEQIAAANDRIKIVIAQGGSAHTGTFHVLVE